MKDLKQCIIMYIPLLKKSDVFVRPTNTDGDADAIPRPEGTILFKSWDINDFTLKRLSNNPKWEEKERKVVL
jgi:hypothetical protein